ncbi:basic 7S globulin 2-like [Abrus precatorius]|uniref:Basic 7S globulin 2-like n=1 Tax=Abrus precatorius TaxID=3816 RepID=A0A8B8MK88_ABRPR|nr:basic 7S globulin 2-like [Abrus precatorius]
MSLPPSFHYFFFFYVICLLFCVCPIPTHATVLVAPISKDKSSNLFTLSVFLKTPIRPTKLFLDLGFLFPWTVCDAGYNSSSFHEITCDPTFCASLGFGALSCDNCSDFGPPDPNCVPANLVCGCFPENPVIRTAGSDAVLVDTLALPSTEGPLVLLPNYTFGCARSTLLKGLPKNVTGLAALGRSNVSFPAQISASLSSPRCFALCFPSSSKAPGVAFFGSTGPYNVSSFSSSEIDLSKSLIYTPLIVNPVGVGDTIINYGGNPPSNQHFIGLTSIQVNGKHVPINATLLSIDKDNGFGGTKISTATPYTLLESSVQKAFTELFVKEAASSAFNLTITSPVKPFNVCYPAGDLTVNPAGPVVPTVDLVLNGLKDDVIWRILGANSMVRVTNKKKGVDLWCLGFVDGGVNKKTPIVIGGKQLEDNLLQFDLETNRLGFTSSLLSRSLSCADFNVTDSTHKS